MLYGYNISQAVDRLVSSDGLSIFSAALMKFNHIYNLILQEFGNSGLFILILFALFLVLIIAIFIQSLINAFKDTQPAEEEQSNLETGGLYYTIDEGPTVSANDNQPETPLYDEEEKERIELERSLSAELLRISQEAAISQNPLLNTKQKMKRDAQKENTRRKNLSAPATADTVSTPKTPDLPTGKIENLNALVITLLSRGVSEAKTVQAIYFYYKNLFKEEDVFQIVRSIRDFIGLCNAGKFDILPNISQLPSPQEALLNLGQGNPAQCLVLLQALLNTQMELAEYESGNLQDLNYAIAANYACLIGNIARINDIELAHNSFELATELSPKSVKAWDRLGDMYILENAPEKAFIAFQNVLDIGDPIIYAPQIADAQHHLATYFEKSGLAEKADEMRRQSDRFYKVYGLRTPLSIIEQTVFQTLLNNSADNLANGVSLLLNYTH